MKNFVSLALIGFLGLLIYGCASTTPDSNKVALGTLGNSTLHIDLIADNTAKSPQRISLTNVSYPIIWAKISLTDPLLNTTNIIWTNGAPTSFIINTTLTGLYTLIVMDVDTAAHTNAATNYLLLQNGFNYSITVRLGGVIYTTVLTSPPSDAFVALNFSGNFLDSTGNGNNGTNGGASFTNDRFNSSNSAVYFNGASSVVITNLGPVTLTHTISEWIKTTTVYGPASYGCIFMSATSTMGWYTMLNNNTLLVGGNNGSGWNFANLGPALNDGNWHNITVVYVGGTNVTAYIDGTNTVSSAVVTYAIAPSPSTAIGSHSYAPTFYFTGSIDDVTIFNRVLSVSEILAIYHFGGF